MFAKIYDKLILKLLSPTTKRMIQNEVKAESAKIAQAMAASLTDNKLNNVSPEIIKLLILVNEKIDFNTKARALDALKPREVMYFG